MKAQMVILSVFLAACSGPEADMPDTGPEPTVFDPLTSTLDRAAGVEDTVRQSDIERRRQIDQAQ